MRFIRSVLCALTVATIVLTLTATAASAGLVTKFYVDDDGHGTATGCDGDQEIFDSIQDAIDASIQGGVVIVCPGVYSESLSISTASLTLRAFKAWTTTIRPAPDAEDGSNLINIIAPDVTVKWLRLRAPTRQECVEIGAMIFVDQDANRAEIRANHIEAGGPNTLGSCGYQTGIRVNPSTEAMVVWNRVTNFKNSGIGLEQVLDSVVRGNTISFLHPNYSPNDSKARGIVAANSETLEVLGNIVKGLSSAGDTTPRLNQAITLINTGFATVRGNRVRYVNEGILLDTGGKDQVFNNRVAIGIAGPALSLLSMGLSNVHDNVMKAGDVSIFVQDTSTGNSIHDNDFAGPADPDCRDDSLGGTGDFGTDNFWEDNLGSGSPAGICTEP